MITPLSAQSGFHRPATVMNRTLKSLNDIIPQIRFLDSIGGRLHETFYKNWDLGLFTRFILERYDKSASILDVGCVSNPLLFNLANCGFSDLCGIDVQLSKVNIHAHPQVHYVEADLTRTPFDGVRFDCITSLSVIEHGVHRHHYLKEMSRILKPGGILLTSTDYWPRKLRTWIVPRRLTLGLPWRIFSEDEIEKFVHLSQRYGFRLTGPLDATASVPVVHVRVGLLSRAYTFITFGLEKQATKKS